MFIHLSEKQTSILNISVNFCCDDGKSPKKKKGNSVLSNILLMIRIIWLLWTNDDISFKHLYTYFFHLSLNFFFQKSKQTNNPPFKTFLKLSSNQRNMLLGLKWKVFKLCFMHFFMQMFYAHEHTIIVFFKAKDVSQDFYCADFGIVGQYLRKSITYSL